MTSGRIRWTSSEQGWLILLWRTTAQQETRDGTPVIRLCVPKKKKKQEAEQQKGNKNE